MKYILAFLFGQNYVNRAIVGFGSGKRTVNGALVHFNRALAELEAVEQQETAEVARRQREIEEASAALEASNREAVRARNKAAKIRTFIGDDDELSEFVSLRSIA